MSSKVIKQTLSLKEFMLRQEVLKLYRDIFRTIRKIPDKNSQNELKEWARRDFRVQQHHKDEIVIKSCIQMGKRSLNELKTSLSLSGVDSLK